jgi:hypothetical protein
MRAIVDRNLHFEGALPWLSMKKGSTVLNDKSIWDEIA